MIQNMSECYHPQFNMIGTSVNGYFSFENGASLLKISVFDI